jgi:hypothetical protein
MSPDDIGNSPNMKNPNRRRNVPYAANDFRLWKFSVVFHFIRIPENRSQMNNGANHKRAYFLYHTKSAASLSPLFFLKMEGKSGRKLL